jgi:hypothetical protein
MQRIRHATSLGCAPDAGATRTTTGWLRSHSRSGPVSRGRSARTVGDLEGGAPGWIAWRTRSSGVVRVWRRAVRPVPPGLPCGQIRPDPAGCPHDSSVSPPDPRHSRRILGPFWGPMPPQALSGCRTERRPRPRIRRSGPSSSVSTQSAPEGIRTPNLLIRSNSLDPTRAEAARPQTKPGQMFAQVTGVQTRQDGPGRGVTEPISAEIWVTFWVTAAGSGETRTAVGERALGLSTLMPRRAVGGGITHSCRRA